jgi:hypothetical protein
VPKFAIFNPYTGTSVKGYQNLSRKPTPGEKEKGEKEK